MKLTSKKIIQALNAGKCIRRKIWADGYFIRRKTNDRLYDEKGNVLDFYTSYLEANDWEVIEKN